MRRTKAQQQEREEAIARLREWMPPGTTVYTILDHVARSGMTRHIRLVVPYTREDGSTDFVHPNHAAALVLGLRQAKRDGLIVGGCGMDMGFHLVYELSHALYGGLCCEGCGKYPSGEYRTVIEAEYRATNAALFPTCEHCGAALKGGYPCLGKGKCPSNYHVNHRNTIRCPGVTDGAGEEHTCFRAEPDDGFVRTIGKGKSQTVVGWRAYVLQRSDRLELCPTCHGEGQIPNPEGPERFDLLHTDGYALRHRWL